MTRWVASGRRKPLTLRRLSGRVDVASPVMTAVKWAGVTAGALSVAALFALFLLAEYAGIVVLSALTVVLFLGGWKGPFDDQLGWLWTLVKTMLLAFVVIWARVSYPRLREDQLQKLAWAGLIPLALLQLALTGVIKVL